MNTPQVPGGPLSRRDFLSRAAAGVALAYLAPLAGRALGATLAPSTSDGRISALELGFFEKYTPDETAQACDEMGLDLELTVRKNGHIKPENAPTELPAMAAALAKRNRRILALALDTVRPDEPHWQDTLRTAAGLGIRQYRHRGFKYDPTKPLKAQIPNFRAMARDFAAFNKEAGIQALYQTHAMPEMAGGAIWDLDMILDDIDPRYFGVDFDTRHVRVEQGLSWPNAIRLIGPRIAGLCVKDFKWTGDQVTAVPVGDGNVGPEMVRQVLAVAGPVPICIHNEYFGYGKSPFAQRAGVVEAFRHDYAALRGWLKTVPNLPAGSYGV